MHLGGFEVDLIEVDLDFFVNRHCFDLPKAHVRRSKECGFIHLLKFHKKGHQLQTYKREPRQKDVMVRRLKGTYTKGDINDIIHSRSCRN